MHLVVALRLDANYLGHCALRSLLPNCLGPAPCADDSVEMAIGFVTEVGALLVDIAGKMLHGCAHLLPVHGLQWGPHCWDM